MTVVLAVGNGGTTDKYVWTQTLGEVSLHVQLPIGFNKRLLEVNMKNTKLKALFDLFLLL